MNRLYIIMIFLVANLSLMAQVPQSVKYQAVVRDNNNNLIVNQSVGLQISVLQGSISGPVIYEETFTENTNGHGLVFLNIGRGTPVVGTFTQIDWKNGPYFLETAIDINGGTSYSVMGTSELLSVPYALYANHSAHADSSVHAVKSDSSGHSVYSDTAGYVLNVASDNYYFQATSGWNGQTISGTQYNEFVNLDTEVLDPSGSFDPHTSTFTAPATGTYSFSGFTTVKALNITAGGVFFGFIVNNASYPDPGQVATSVISPGQYTTETVVPLSGIINLNAGDTVRFGIIGADNGENFSLSYSALSGYKIR